MMGHRRREPPGVNSLALSSAHACRLRRCLKMAVKMAATLFRLRHCGNPLWLPPPFLLHCLHLRQQGDLWFRSCCSKAPTIHTIILTAFSNIFKLLIQIFFPTQSFDIFLLTDLTKQLSIFISLYWRICAVKRKKNLENLSVH